jgi:hypothetical protein
MSEFYNGVNIVGSMSTDIYNKPTDKHQYLSPQSCHPKHCTKSIPYSQALRIKRICSNEQTTKKRLGELKFFEDFTQFWVFLYGCPVLMNDAG